jgi:hypothetical protein
MANRRNNKQHPLGVVIPMEDVEEEQPPPVEDAVTTLVDAHPDDSFEIYLAIKMPNGETLDIKRRLSRDELERSLPWRRPDVVLQNIVNMGVEITKGLYLGPNSGREGSRVAQEFYGFESPV